MRSHLRLTASPVARPEAVVQGDRWRISVLADGLVRLEWSEDGAFEDRASTFALHRDLPVPEFEVVDGEAALEIVTERLRLTYDRGPFTPAGLSVQARGNISNHHSVWRYGEPTRDLGGTTRTLDDVDGRIELDPGIVSAAGVTALDDSSSFLFEDDGWVSPRPGGKIDVYVFSYGHDYQAALDAFFAVSGRPPVLPRWVLGNWWSRYHRYSTDSYLQPPRPLPRRSACRSRSRVLDMDWHRVDSVPERYGSGWTGYSWERELFPDPESFLAELHRRGLRVTLNVHPATASGPTRTPTRRWPRRSAATLRRRADRVRHHRPRRSSTPTSSPPPPDRGPGRRLLVARLAAGQLLAHPGHRPAVDAQPLPLPRLRPRRPPPADVLALRGPGQPPLPIGFSGDTHISWASLDFQPEFTATASNIGLRLVEPRRRRAHPRHPRRRARHPLGAARPVLADPAPALLQQPVPGQGAVAVPAEARAAMGDALRFRHRLVPYLHTMNHRASTDGIPLVRPMYHLAPEDERAYGVPNQFAFAPSC
jgi:hypothetical protein